MEVHHPHHPTHKKKWNEYILEFIMLFAAVSLGFLAENIRERQIEDHRAEEFIELFKNEVVNNNKQIDSVLKQDIPLLKANEKIYYDLATLNNGFPLIELSDTLNLYLYRFSNDKRIFDQMKNSGSLRYIKDKKLIDMITSYEIEADMAEFRAFDQETSQWKDLWTFLNDNMPSSFMLRMLINKRLSIVNDQNPEVYQLYEKNKILFENKLKNKYLDESIKEKLINYMAHRTSLQKLSIANYRRVQKKGNALIEELDNYLKH
jgi:hypothetical protein